MKNNKSIQKEIAGLLRGIGSEKCLDKAKMIENDSSSISVLNLRDLELSSSNITSITSFLKKEEIQNHDLIKSISFSYNHLLCDIGVIALINNLPQSIREIGLVDCGISDVGGIEILNWMRNASNLQMICMEQNIFSEKLKFEFKKFSVANTEVVVVY